ncbi:unnamed protein product [Aspergillus oryzae]|nr:unnamed protein product [Aspergillus oryzae]
MSRFNAPDSAASNMTPKSILSVNAGSSSVKITFYTFEQPPKAVANAQISGITAPPATLKYTRGSTNHKEQLKEKLSTPQDAFKFLLQRCFSDPNLSEVTSTDDLAFICHRVVHGGDYERSTLPDYVKTYPINQDTAKANGLRKYGFHGISYSFILRSVAQFLGKPVEKTNVIAMHIGSGASVCAIKEGRSIDTSSIQAEEILNKKSGWKALTGTTDFAQIAVENPPSPEHKLAFDILVDRILGYIGNYFVKLEGKVDALVFAGGIGEKSALLRKTVIDKCQCLGVAIDASANDKGPSDDQTVMDISKGDGSGPRVIVCQTDEQVRITPSSSILSTLANALYKFEMAYNCILTHGSDNGS